MTNPNDYDPLADSEKSPAMSFKDQPVGTVHTVDVGEPGKFIQQRDFDTDEPAVWDDGNPKMAAVFNGTGIDGANRSHCGRRSRPICSRRLAGAQKALGRRIGMSDQIDRIHVKLADRVPGQESEVHEVDLRREDRTGRREAEVRRGGPVRRRPAAFLVR